MELWEKVLAAKNKAEADSPLADRHAGSEKRDMEIFIAMVQAAVGGEDDDEPEPEAETAKPAAYEDSD